MPARFDGGKLTGNAGCSDYNAEYAETATQLKVGPVAVTKKMCAAPEGVMEQENAYLKTLAEVGAINQFARLDPVAECLWHASADVPCGFGAGAISRSNPGFDEVRRNPLNR